MLFLPNLEVQLGGLQADVDQVHILLGCLDAALGLLLEATKNSILLVEYAIVTRRDHGLSRVEARLDACYKRAHPVIMTTLAMGAGMLPIAVSWGAADASFRSPMAVAMIGGLMTSTVLSLLVIPAVFTLVEDVGQWLRRGGRRG